MKKWMVLMLAVGFVLTASFSAQADSVMLPWIVKSPTVSTIVSVVNTANVDRLHLRYYYKADNRAEDRFAICKEVDFFIPTSPNDIVVFDAASKINRGKPLYGDTEVTGALRGLSVPYLSGALTTLGISEGQFARGVLTINNDNNADQTIYAEAMVLELANGATWGYDGYNPVGNVTTEDYDDSGVSDSFGQIISDNEYAFLVIHPLTVFTTRLFVTPVDNSTIAYDQRPGRWATNVYLAASTDGSDRSVYDDNEEPYSGASPTPTVCTSALDIATYLPKRLVDAFNEGYLGEMWAYVKVKNLSEDTINVIREQTGNIVYSTNQAAVGKLEFAVSGTSIDGTRVPGATNNFIWLKSRQPQQP